MKKKHCKRTITLLDQHKAPVPAGATLGTVGAMFAMQISVSFMEHVRPSSQPPLQHGHPSSPRLHGALGGRVGAGILMRGRGGRCGVWRLAGSQGQGGRRPRISTNLANLIPAMHSPPRLHWSLTKQRAPGHHQIIAYIVGKILCFDSQQRKSSLLLSRPHFNSPGGQTRHT